MSTEGSLKQLATISGSVYELAAKILVLGLIIAIGQLYVVTINRVIGQSMGPSLASGELIIVNKAAYLWQRPHRGDVVTVRFPGDPEKTRQVKRIIGLPGETVSIEKERILVNGKPLAESYIENKPRQYQPKIATLGSNEYYLLGDNRPVSSDSRVYGPVERRFIIGRVSFVFWPFSEARAIPGLVY